MKTNLRLASVATLLLLAACEGSSSERQDAREEADGPEDAVALESTQQGLLAAPIIAKYDTTLHSGSPNNNDGASATLGVTALSVADIQRTLIRFEQADINAAIPAGNVLHSARIDLSTTGVSVGWLGDSMDIFPMTKAWVEGNTVGNGASWLCANDTNTSFFGNFSNDCANPNNWRMTPGGPFPQPYVTTATDRTSLFSNGLTLVSFDVTADVQKFLAGTPNHGWMIAGSPNLVGGQTVTFASRTNGDVSKRPKLVIEYGPDQCTSDPNKGVPGACGCGVPDLDSNQDNVPDCYDATVVATQDTPLRLAVPFGNDGTGALLPATSASVVNLERSLVRIDSFAIASATNGRAIKKAELELTVAGIAVGWLGGRVALNRMTRSWVEGNGLAGHGASWTCTDDTNTTLLGLYWNDCAPGNGWNMPLLGLTGGPFLSTPSATAGISWPGVTTVRFDVTEDIKKFAADPAGVMDPNFGWILQGIPSNFASGAWVNFGSRESGAPPRLLLDLDPLCPAGTAGDSDGDGVLDCQDGCIADPGKSEPGFCGCGIADGDTDGDKIPNCIDPCPADGDPTLGGGCGCPSTPVAQGTSCVGACAGSGDPSGQDVCDGQGHCGNPATCAGPIAGGNCKPFITSSDFYWSCDPRDADTAKNGCESVRGQKLVQIDSEAENNLVRARIVGDTWLGARQAQQSQWRWANGTGVQFWQGNSSGAPYFGRFSDWASAQPNTGNVCVAMVAATGEWQSRPCNTPLNVLCVRPKGSIPFHPWNPATIPVGCEITGNCGIPNDDSDCIDPAAANLCDWRADPASCGEATRNQLDACDVCMKSNPAVCNESSPPADCEKACEDACEGAAAFAPNAAERCTSIEDSYNGPIRCALTSAPAGATAQVCVDDVDCGGGQRCGVAFYCTSDGVTRGAPCSITNNDPTTPPGQDRCPGNPADECLAFNVCGTVNPNCADGDFGVPTEPCREIDLCVPAADDYTVAEPTAEEINDLLTPSVLVPEDAFGPAQLPTANLTETRPDPACPYPQTNCAPPNTKDHAWCRYDVDEQLVDRGSEQRKDTKAGPAKLTFTFDPRFTLDYKLDAGPLGLPLPSVEAEASLVATSRIAIFKNVDTGELSILDVGLGAEMGLKLNKRNEDALNKPGFDAATDLCGFRAKSRAKILGLDLIPANFAKGLSFPEEPKQKACVETMQTLIEQIDRVRKAYADARELVRQYEALRNDINNPRTFGGSINGGTLCEQVAKNPPRGFPSFGGDCSLEAPEATINRFIYYYNVVVIDELRAAARQLADKLDLWIAVNENSPVGNFPVINKKEEITIFNQTFMIGPVPVNLEVMLPISYGFNITVYPKLALGNLAKQLIIGDDSLSGSDPFAQLTVSAAPYASAAVSLFAGVGFDVGFAAAKIGIEGSVSLGLLTLPVAASAGLAAGVEPDQRNLNPAFASLFDNSPNRAPLIPRQKVNFSLFYQYGADLQIRDVLNGELSGRLKIKFFWFSISYRARLLRFKGLCSEPKAWEAAPTGDPKEYRKKWCDVPLFNSGIKDAWDWGSIQMPMLFTPMKYVQLPALPLNKTAKFSVEIDPNIGAGGVKELFYDSLCQCLPVFDPKPGAYNNPKECFRDEDCCSGYCASSGGRNVCQPRVE